MYNVYTYIDSKCVYDAVLSRNHPIFKFIELDVFVRVDGTLFSYIGMLLALFYIYSKLDIVVVIVNDSSNTCTTYKKPLTHASAAQ